MNAVIIIPAYNVSETISRLLKELNECKLDVVFIDDGSTDSTYDILNKTKYIILKNIKNMGISYSIGRGLEYAISENYSHVILLDADGQHSAKYIPKFLEQFSKFDFVFGNRFHANSNAPDMKWNVNILGALIINTLFNTSFTDISCGFKGFRLSGHIADIIKSSNGYELVYDLLLYSIKNKANIGFVNMDAIYYYNKLLLSRRVELLALINALERQFPDKKENSKWLEQLNFSILNENNFYISLNNIDFWGFYLKSEHAYIIQANPFDVHNYVKMLSERGLNGKNNF